jgi:hypothetical protein
MRGLGEEWKRKQTRIDLENTKGTRFRWKPYGSLTLEVREKDIPLGVLRASEISNAVSDGLSDGTATDVDG